MMRDRDDLWGRTLGEFVLRERIGEGAFGAVYRCEQSLLGREAVIKVLHGRHRARQVMIQRFLREARLASRLDHPYVAHVYAFGVESEDGLLWLAMEMVHGMPLDRWLRERGPLALAVFVPFFEDLAEVVHAAHQAGIVHRDLKPSNVMVIERSGRLLPKLLDLGIAKLFAGEAAREMAGEASRARRVAPSFDEGEPATKTEAATLTRSHLHVAGALPGAALTQGSAVVGSPPYMAPEQWSGGAVGPPSDLYSLGILAYESLTGRRPFIAATLDELAELHLSAANPPLGAGFAPALDRFFERALAKRPRDRPASALELASELRVASGLDEVPVEWIADEPRLLADAASAEVELPCPYPGIRPYAADAAAHFHGREVEVVEILARLRSGEREIYVIGPSGSGKSSLVAAGVLPPLTRGVSGLGTFLVRSLRPGEHPATRLAEVLEGDPVAPATAVDALLARSAPSTSLMLVVDQLEELFTLAREHERATFLAALRALRAEPRCVLMFTLRADFYGAFMESPLWVDLQGRISRLEVVPLRGPALRAAIEQPARDLGVSFEPELVERLLADAASEPGILPLLQETLIQLWDRRRLRLLTLADYETLGDGGRSGLAVAISRRADATLRALTRTQEAIARRILLRLVSFGEGRSNTRRQQPLSALRAAGDEAVDFDAVVQRLVADRLLTITGDGEGDGARLDLAHEVMITTWPTLADWIQIRRADEQHRRRLEAAAALWNERGRGEGGLLDPSELAEAEAWRKTEAASDLGESSDVAALVAASSFAHEKRRRRRRRLVWSAFGAFAVLATAILALAVRERRRANEAEDSRRESRRLLARSYQEAGQQLVSEGRLLAALPYLVAARKQGEEGQPLRMLFGAATRFLSPTPPLDHQGLVVWSATFSPDGTRVVTASMDKTARVWDATTGKLRYAPLEHQGAVTSAAFSPDGTRVVTASLDRTAHVWDAVTGKPLSAPLEHQGAVTSARFSPDGARVVTTSLDRTARVWDAMTGQPLSPPLEHQGAVTSAAFSPDGTRVVSSDRTAHIWDAATGKSLLPPLEHHGWVMSAAFSPDGARVVTASLDRTARVWDATTGKPLSPPLEHRGEVLSAKLSPDGTRVVTASRDKTARVWDATTGEPLTPPLEHQDFVVSAAFSPDGTRVVTASADADRTARLWDAMTGKPLSPPFEHRRAVTSAAFSPDGTRVVTASADGTARLWDVTRPFFPPLEHEDVVYNAAFSLDGTRVVTASWDKTARVWDARTGKPLSRPLEHQDRLSSAKFSPDGTRVVTASGDKTARVWNATTGEPLSPPLEHRGRVHWADFSSDGTRVVTGSWDRTGRVWDAMTGKPLSPPLEHQGIVTRAAFSPDGARIVTASRDRTARIWDAATGKPLLPPLEHRSAARCAAFSPDGTRVITVSDSTAQIWDATTGKPLSPPLAHRDDINIVNFDSGGTRVVTASLDGTAQVWDATTGKPLAPPLVHQGEISNAVFNPDGTRVVTASQDRTVRIWDAATGEPLSPPLKHRAAVYGAAFSPDGRHVLTWSEDGTARIWEPLFDGGTLAQWSEIEERVPYMLSDGVLVTRPSRMGRYQLDFSAGPISLELIVARQGETSPRR